jgi:hypothetical protein
MMSSGCSDVQLQTASFFEMAMPQDHSVVPNVTPDPETGIGK